MSYAIHPDTRLGLVHLSVANLEPALTFYTQRLGMQLHRRQGDTAYLGAGQEDLLRLTQKAGAKVAKRRTGLYHFALLLPHRLALAHMLARIAQQQTPLDGMADHLVSEALYLGDRDEHGIEIYRDRPRSEWVYQQEQLQLTTQPLNVNSLLAETKQNPLSAEHQMPANTIMGHVHLQVNDLPSNKSFYVNTLGFDLITDYGSAASFVSAGGYHHHIGMNIWNSAGAQPPAADELKLEWFTLVLPTTAVLHAHLDHLRQANLTLETCEEGFFTRDPAGNGIIFTATPSHA